MKRVVLALLGLAWSWLFCDQGIIIDDKHEGDCYAKVKLGLWWSEENADYRSYRDSTAVGTRLGYHNQLYNNSCIGLKIGEANDSPWGQLEIGFGESRIYLRQLWGEFKFGDVRLLLGKTDTGFDNISSQATSLLDDEDALSWGMACDERVSQIRLTFDDWLQLALMEPNAVDPDSLGEVQNLMPKTNLRADWELGPLELIPVAGINYSQFDSSVSNASTLAYVAALTAKLEIFDLELTAQAWTSQNPTDYGLRLPMEIRAVMRPDGKDFLDTRAYGGYAQIRQELPCGNAVCAGAGTVSAHRSGFNHDDDAFAAYFQYEAPLGKFLTAVPEAGVFNYGKDPAGKSEGALYYAGVKFEADF
jgi:hypothetical protein